jgi:hypothetical protein
VGQFIQFQDVSPFNFEVSPPFRNILIDQLSSGGNSGDNYGQWLLEFEVSRRQPIESLTVQWATRPSVLGTNAIQLLSVLNRTNDDLPAEGEPPVIAEVRLPSVYYPGDMTDGRPHLRPVLAV